MSDDEERSLHDLLELSAQVVRRVYLPSLERCRTITDARREVDRHDSSHAYLAMELKKVWDVLARAQRKREAK